MENDVKAIQYLTQRVSEKPEFLAEVITAITQGVKERINYMNTLCTKKDKAILVLFEKNDFGSEDNLRDTAEMLTKSAFNGTGKHYTVEDIKKSFSQ